jgi:hypothetical protein
LRRAREEKNTLHLPGDLVLDPTDGLRNMTRKANHVYFSFRKKQRDASGALKSANSHTTRTIIIIGKDKMVRNSFSPN